MNERKTQINRFGSKFNIESEVFTKATKLQIYNETLAEYFNKLADEVDSAKTILVRASKLDGETLRKKAEAVSECVKFWNWNVHKSYEHMDLQSVNFCRSRFCPNCQTQLQDKRFLKYKGVIDEMRQRDGVTLYMITFTQTNVKGKELNRALTIMEHSFARLVEYLSGKKTIKGLPLVDWGFLACIRSGEITFKTNRDEYHHHLHAIFAFKNFPESPQTIVNRFSRSNGVITTLFSSEEILLQKLWRLIYDRQYKKEEQQARAIKRDMEKLASVKRIFPELEALPIKEAIEKAKELVDVNDLFKKKKQTRSRKITLSDIKSMSNNDGYSVKVDKIIDDNYRQVFKYAIKSMSSDEKEFMPYRVFKVLFDVMYNRRAFQGYGEWVKIIDVDDDEVYNDTHEAYELYRRALATDVPLSLTCSAMDSLNYSNDNGYLRTSPKSFSQWYSEASAEERAEFHTTFGEIERKLGERIDLDNLREATEEEKARYNAFFKKTAKKLHDFKYFLAQEHYYEEHIAPYHHSKPASFNPNDYSYKPLKPEYFLVWYDDASAEDKTRFSKLYTDLSNGLINEQVYKALEDWRIYSHKFVHTSTNVTSVQTSIFDKK